MIAIAVAWGTKSVVVGFEYSKVASKATKLWRSVKTIATDLLLENLIAMPAMAA